MMATFFNHDVRVPHLFDGMPYEHLPCDGKEARAFFLSEVEDAVQLNESLRTLLPWAREHAYSIGLPVSEHVVFGNGSLIPAQYKERQIDVFCIGEQYTPNESTLELVLALNNKNTFITLAKSMDLATPNTQVYGACGRARMLLLATEASYTHKVVKAAVSAGGQDVVVPRPGSWSLAGLPEVLRLAGRHFQLQEMVYDAEFYGVQVNPGPDGLRSIRATKQVLRQNSYAGATTDIAPEIESDVLKATSPMIDHIWSSGLRTFCLDVAYGQVIRRTGHIPKLWDDDEPILRYTPRRALLLECNPRYGASTYPERVARRLDHHDWDYRYFHVAFREYSDVNIDDIEYDPATRCGVVVVDWGSVLHGEVGVLFLGTPDERQQLMREFHRRFAAK